MKKKKFNWGKFIFITFICIFVGLALTQVAFAQFTDYNIATQVRPGSGIYTAWNWIRSLVNVLAVLGLLFIAFANILHIQLDTYAIRRMLPALILGLILANFSNLICRVLIDFSTILSSAFAGPRDGGVNGVGISRMIGLYDLVRVMTTGDIRGIGDAILGFLGMASLGFGPIAALFLLFLFIVPPTILLLCVAFMLYARIYIIWFLVIIAPLAFFGAVFSPLNFLWKKWINYFLVWLLIGPIVFLVLRIGILVVDVAESAGWQFGTWVFGSVMLYLCLKVPGIVGGALAAAAGALGNIISGKKQFIGMYDLSKKGAAIGAKAGGMAALNRAAGTRAGGAVLGGIERLKWTGERYRLSKEQAQKRGRQDTITDTLRNGQTPAPIRNRAMAEKDKHLDELPQITYQTPSAAHIFQDATGLEETAPRSGRFIIRSNQRNGLWNAYRNGGVATADIRVDTPAGAPPGRLLYRAGQRISAEDSDAIGENMRRLQLKIGNATVVDGGAGGAAERYFDEAARTIRRDSLGRDVNTRADNQIYGAYRGRYRGSNFA